MSVTAIAAFLLGTIILIIISRKSLKNHASHGFYRFFAFELMLIMVIIIAPVWSEDPFSLQQQISWSFSLASLMLIIHSITLLLVMGLPQNSRPESSNLAFENTTRLVVVGVFRFIRHPMYMSIILLNLGILLKAPTYVTVGLGFMVVVFLYIAARVEEKENIAYFGEEYLNYMKKTKMFIPFIF